MKTVNKTLILLSISFFISCAGNKGNFEISGTLVGKENKWIYLTHQATSGVLNLDSTEISTEGKFSLSADIFHKDFYQVTVSGDQQGFIFIAQPNQSIEVSFDEYPASYSQLDGSEETKAFYAFNQKSRDFLQERSNLYNTGMQQGQNQMELMNKMNELQVSFATESADFIKNNLASPAALAAVQSVNPIENVELLRQLHEGLKAEMQNSVYLKNLEGMLAQVERQVQAQKAQELQEQKRTEIVGPGKEAPEIVMQDPAGKMRKLSDLRGKVVLIDFWASWCKPCRRENPNVVRMYKKYKSKGFEIFGVSLDRNKNAWVKAIQDDKLTWQHVSDLKFWQSAAAQLYMVNSIPFTVLVDKEGKVIATNLRGPQLEAKLEEIFS